MLDPLGLSTIHNRPDHESIHQNPQCYKVVVKNLPKDVSTETAYGLVEQNTRMYVHLVQPAVILQRINGQTHAYIKFVEQHDAEMCVQRMNGLSHSGRKLHVSKEK